MSVEIKGVHTKEPVDVSKSKGFLVAMRNTSSSQSEKVVIRAYNHVSNYLYDTATLHFGISGNRDDEIGKAGMVCYIQLGAPGPVTIRFELEVGGRFVQNFIQSFDGAVYAPRFSIEDVEFYRCYLDGKRKDREVAGGKTKYKVSVRNVGLADGKAAIMVRNDEGELLAETSTNVDVGELSKRSVYVTINEPGDHRLEFSVSPYEDKDYVQSARFLDTTWENTEKEVILDIEDLKQTDPRWEANPMHTEQYGYSGDIGNTGCALVSGAMVLGLGVMEHYNYMYPINEDCPYGWNAAASHYGVTYTRKWGSFDELKDIIYDKIVNKGIPVIGRLAGKNRNNKDTTHFFVIKGFKGDPDNMTMDMFLINDPGSSRTSTIADVLVTNYHDASFTRIDILN